MHKSVCLSDRQVSVKCEGGALFCDGERFSKGSSVILEISDDSPAQLVQPEILFFLVSFLICVLLRCAHISHLNEAHDCLVCFSQGCNNRDQHGRDLVQAHRWQQNQNLRLPASERQIHHTKGLKPRADTQRMCKPSL